MAKGLTAGQKRAILNKIHLSHEIAREAIRKRLEENLELSESEQQFLDDLQRLDDLYNCYKSTLEGIRMVCEDQVKNIGYSFYEYNPHGHHANDFKKALINMKVNDEFNSLNLTPIQMVEDELELMFLDSPQAIEEFIKKYSI